MRRSGLRKIRRGSNTTFDTVRRLALALPGVEEGVSYGTPAFRIRGKLLARLREDGGSLVVKTDYDTREALMSADPETFYITDHYKGYPWILVRLRTVHPGDLRGLLETAWRKSAPKRLVADFERNSGA